jgi:hypothetical protein
MKRSGWSRPSPALVIACLALFVALGGTVLAATKIDGRAIRVKSLPGNRLQPASVPGNRLRKGTIPGNRIVPGSLKGSRIDVGTLRQVPNAAHADFADTARRAQTAIAADHAADATTINGHAVGCAQGRREWAGACWDVKPSEAAVTLDEAVAACGAEGGELPNALSFTVFADQPGVSIDVGGEWTNQVGTIGAVDAFAVVIVYPGGRVYSASPAEHLHFRCVTPFLD